MNVQKNKQDGFTIIEVVLVLAIAALIFLMVFIALPALQRSQRDTQRKNDLSRVQTAIQNFQSNNRNRVPTAAELTSTAGTGFIPRYLTVGGDTFEDPSGTPYTISAGAVNAEFQAGQIRYFTGQRCDGETLAAATGANKIAFQYKLEGGGIACVSN